PPPDPPPSPYTTLFRSRDRRPSLRSRAARTEALGADAIGGQADALEPVRGDLHECRRAADEGEGVPTERCAHLFEHGIVDPPRVDRKSTRLNSSHVAIS